MPSQRSRNSQARNGITHAHTDARGRERVHADTLDGVCVPVLIPGWSLGSIAGLLHGNLLGVCKAHGAWHMAGLECIAKGGASRSRAGAGR